MYIVQTPTHHFPLKETIDFSIFLILWPIVPFHRSTGNMHVSFCLPNICNDTEPRTYTTVWCLLLFRVEIWKEDYDLFLQDKYVNVSDYHNEFITLLVREHVLSVACFIIQSRYIWILPIICAAKLILFIWDKIEITFWKLVFYIFSLLGYECACTKLRTRMESTLARAPA